MKIKIYTEDFTDSELELLREFEEMQKSDSETLDELKLIRVPKMLEDRGYSGDISRQLCGFTDEVLPFRLSVRNILFLANIVNFNADTRKNREVYSGILERFSKEIGIELKFIPEEYTHSRLVDIIQDVTGKSVREVIVDLNMEEYKLLVETLIRNTADEEFGREVFNDLRDSKIHAENYRVLSFLNELDEAGYEISFENVECYERLPGAKLSIDAYEDVIKGREIYKPFERRLSELSKELDRMKIIKPVSYEFEFCQDTEKYQ